MNNLTTFSNIEEPEIRADSFLSKNNIQESSNSSNKGDNTLTIENDYLFKNMTSIQFEGLILDLIKNNPDIESIDFSKIIKNKNIHSSIHNIIGNNYPLLEIFRLIEGFKVVDLTFIGIKHLNDNISKEFVDIFIEKLKNILIENFSITEDNEKNSRIIRSNYKHLTFSLEKNIDLSKKLFHGIKSKEILISEILDSITDKELHNLTPFSGDIVSIRKQINKIITDEFDFGIGTSIVPKGGDKEKLKAFYMAEIGSRNKINIEDISNSEIIHFNFENVKVNAKKALNIEENIINEYIGKKINYDGIDFDIIINGKISDLLLKFVRKGENINNLLLNDKISTYINHLNDGFDFILPVIDELDFTEIKKYNEQISKGIIDSKLFLYNHKHSLTTNGLKKLSKGKEGLRLFIDIVDMGIMNLNDFRNLAVDVSSGKIKEDNIDKLLKAGNTATSKFQLLIKNIKIKYPNVQISLGGDEVFIYIPGKTKKQEDEIVLNISKELEKLNLKGRLSTSFQKDNEKIYDDLDNITQINKVFEKLFEKTIQKYKNMNHIYDSIKITKIHFNSKSINNLQSIIDQIIEQISEYDLIKLMESGKEIEKEINCSNNKYKFKLNIKKINNLIIIDIH